MFDKCFLFSLKTVDCDCKAPCQAYASAVYCLALENRLLMVGFSESSGFLRVGLKNQGEKNMKGTKNIIKKTGSNS